ncbi:hypothetical protein S101106_01890 [Levilactobacillus brevis]|nr:hypothetical protein S101106_01890 [Levilactobacillus brevis]QCZ51380.1 HTH-type transcriptional regulator ArsR family [Levilactobacillus brevis]
MRIKGLVLLQSGGKYRKRNDGKGIFAVDVDISEKSIPVFSALDSPVRLKIINLLSKSKMNVKELSQELGLSSTIIIMHLNKLEAANIIRTEKQGTRRISSLRVDTINISFPKQLYVPYDSKNIELPVGQYTKYEVSPSCGLAGQNGFIGKVDDPKYFMTPERDNAGMVWFAKGYVEYQIPNYIDDDQRVEMLEVSMELSSEFPFSNNNWKSDLFVTLNGKEVGSWQSPGDFSDTRGRLTPSWVYDDMNQYGILKLFRISKHGSFIDGHYANDTKISDIDLSGNSWTLRIGVKPNANYVGGCTIYGRQFGNHNQGIKCKVYYSNEGE